MEELRASLIHAARVSAMGTMASTLAHELNQPITAVNNYVEGVRDMLPDADAFIREALDDASREALRARSEETRLNSSHSCASRMLASACKKKNNQAQLPRHLTPIQRK